MTLDTTVSIAVGVMVLLGIGFVTGYLACTFRIFDDDDPE